MTNVIGLVMRGRKALLIACHLIITVSSEDDVTIINHFSCLMMRVGSINDLRLRIFPSSSPAATESIPVSLSNSFEFLWQIIIGGPLLP
ncbi:Uncharacterized protein APZ42_014329 [Daphnia magna]|uniref:Secreted protein n=1 Tax=Daphnia magna TaxID=35525 RepID=A0A162Q7I1_9CRUS|nr:Uncharacterized protein APZ42_014329 [Daphnia magna]